MPVKLYVPIFFEALSIWVHVFIAILSPRRETSSKNRSSGCLVMPLLWTFPADVAWAWHETW